MAQSGTVIFTRLAELDAQGSIGVCTPAEYWEIHAVTARNVPFESLNPEIVMRERNGTAGETLQKVFATVVVLAAVFAISKSVVAAA